MIIATTIDEVRAQVGKWRKAGLTIGLVPTMGYLHDGHASLIDCAKTDCDKVVASVFVNPTQFAPNEDFGTYPRDFEHDKQLLEGHGCDMVFHPDVNQMYLNDNGETDTYVEIFSDMTTRLCGKTRPTHFRGVCTVVAKLFNIVLPDKAFFGQKDAQQLSVIRHMVDKLSYGIEIIGCPIVREPDGLAKSSRNTYLSEEERKAALILSKSIFLGKEMVKNGETNLQKIVEAMGEKIKSEPMAKIDYVEAVNMTDMLPVQEISGETLFAIAVYIGKTRLIDNFIAGEVELNV